MNNINFARNLVKGKIAETVFAQMHREAGEFTVLEFGYEKIIPELVQQGYKENNGMIETLRTAPDFAVIDRRTRNVKLIEVKYMRALNTGYVFKDAERMSQSWNPSYLFIATLEGFYFDEINKIIDYKGDISKLDNSHISDDLQKQYLQILIDFEKNN
ncbi:MAG: hypothetical protein PF572_05740 [Patescibacteria group bacterium]|jgi:hypothetical protein|nr:hypothetical protein [Patescibacteria group bacterium]